MTKLIILPIALLLTLLNSPFVDAGTTERIWFDAKINDKDVRLIFDTGASFSALFRGAAERLGLKITKIDRDVYITEECKLTIGSTSTKWMFPVIDVPSYITFDGDGVISWSTVTNPIVLLDFEKVLFGFADDLPADIMNWTKWRLVPNVGEVLVFETANGSEKAMIGIDTGSPDGVQLSPKRWEKWRRERAGQASTLKTSWQFIDGLQVYEVLRAKQITIGGLTFSDVPVHMHMASPTGDGFHSEHLDAILGLFALKQLRVVIDGKNGVVYTSVIPHSSAQYEYNRLGAVFVPKEPETSDDLVAHVSKGSPADRAGIKDGDILLRIGERDATKWRTNQPNPPREQFYTKPAGTKLKLTLKRGNRQYETIVTLYDPPAK